MNLSQTMRRMLFGLLIVVVIVAATLLMRYNLPLTARFLETIELRFVDMRFQVRGPFEPEKIKAVSKLVTIVALDDEATRRYSTVLPRSVHAKLVRQLKKAGATAIIFDVIFADPGKDKAAADDLMFARECAAAGNVFLPFDDESASITPPALAQQLADKLSYPLEVPKTAEVIRIRPPIDPLLKAMRGGGHVATKSDVDGKFRNAILLMECDKVYPHAVLDAVLRTKWGVDPASIKGWNGSSLEIGEGANIHRLGPMTRGELTRSFFSDTEKKVVSERGGAIWSLPLNFIGGHEEMQELTVPYIDALEGRADDRLKDRVVIVGATATGTIDLRPNPFESKEIFRGVETNATLVANLINDDFLKLGSLRVAIVVTLLCGLIAGLAAVGLRPSVALLLTTLTIAFYGGLAAYYFSENNMVLEMTAPLVATLTCYMVLTAFRLVYADREAKTYAIALRETEEILGLHVNPRIAHELRDNPQTRLAMQIGTRREVSVLFTDIRNFTAWSDDQAPEEVKARLDEYFPVMCEIATDDYDGYIDKFIGDELMIVWNAHKDQPDHAERAVRAGLSMQRALTMLNDGWRRQKQAEFRIGVGIASGPAVFGTFGSARHKLMPTVLGDTVNFASRLESTTKETGSQVIISMGTYEAVKNIVEVKPLGAIPIRGKSESQPIYEVLGVQPSRDDGNLR